MGATGELADALVHLFSITVVDISRFDSAYTRNVFACRIKHSKYVCWTIPSNGRSILCAHQGGVRRDGARD